jgi:acetyl-CoA acetyltransferase
MTDRDQFRSFSAIGCFFYVETVPADPPVGRSFLMDMYAGAALRYMERTGTTRADLARVVVKNHRHGQLNPAAQYGGELTVEQVLAAREIVWPFTLQMCSPISDGAAAALLVSQDLGSPGPAVAVLASAVRSAPADEMTSVTSLAAVAAYEQAGLVPADLHCVEVHDAAASAELVIYEQLGLAEPGQRGPDQATTRCWAYGRSTPAAACSPAGTRSAPAWLRSSRRSPRSAARRVRGKCPVPGLR